MNYSDPLRTLDHAILCVHAFDEDWAFGDVTNQHNRETDLRSLGLDFCGLLAHAVQQREKPPCSTLW